MSRFHKYSTRNTLLIHLQKPNATLVAGFTSWQNKFDRHVKKGEKAIKIFAPVPFTKREEKEKLDPETSQPIIGEDGLPEVEYIERKLARFKVTNVFDVKQTDGKPLPTLVQDLTGNVEQYEAFMDALRAVSPLTIVIEPMPENTDGACYFGDRIAIREGMSEIQTVSAVIHEITHAKLHDIESLRLMDETATPKDRRTQEVEAESVSYAVCQFFSIETGDNSFGYVTEWSRGRELKELNASLDTIRKTAAELIEDVDGKFQELVKERNIALAIGEEQLRLEEIQEQQPSQPEQSQEDIITDSTTIEFLSAEEDTPSANVYASPLIAEYAHHAEVANPQRVGAVVLMPPVFDGGNFNRTGKRIRVTVEEPAGKYQLYSREEHGDTNFYFLTASGMVDRTSQYFRDEWSDEQRKWVGVRPTEAQLDEILPQIAMRFESDMANPTKWAMYQHAAVLNRIDDAEAHNVPVRELREVEREQRREAAEQEKQEQERQFQVKYDSRIDEIAKAIENGEVISVGHNEYTFGGKNPVLDLFRLYDVELPLRTQGWVNTGLAEITENSYRYYSSKNKGNSTTFSRYLKNLREAIKETPIEQKREYPVADVSVQNTVENKTVERKLYEKFSEMLPQFASREYSYLRLEAGDSFMPLSLEWIGENLISVMHTYELNGELCYDPMIVFRTGFEGTGENEEQTLTAVEFQQSNPPIYQVEDADGYWNTIDGNGNEKSVLGLQKEINDFATQWFFNIGTQGYMFKRGTIEIDGVDVRVTFDADGNLIMPEAENPKRGLYDSELYAKFTQMFPEFMNSEYTTLRLEAEHAKPLELEWVFGDRISIAHTYELNGKPAFDPLVMLGVKSDEKTMFAYSFELSDPPREGIVYKTPGEPDVELQENIHRLTSQWLDRAAKQNFIAVVATVDIDGEDVPVSFDIDGKPIMPESKQQAEDKPSKKYDLNYGHLGNGLTFWNSAEEKDGDYVTVAHIGPDRAIKLYDNDMPDNLKAHIDLLARTSHPRISTSQPEQRVFHTPPQPYTLTYNEIPVHGVEVYNDIKEQVANVLDNGRIEYTPGCFVAKSAKEEIETFAENRATERESEFLNYDGNAYGVYLFEPKLNNNRAVKENYRLAWFGKLDKGDTLDTIRKNFEDISSLPYDFIPRENNKLLGVLDIIAIKEDGEITPWYVDLLAYSIKKDFFGDEQQKSLAPLDSIEGEIIAPEVTAEITEIDLSLPDPTTSISEMKLYGYASEDVMLPLSNGRAVELFDADHCIYLLYPDDTEGMAFDREEIQNHDGLCGIERVDWEKSPIRAAQLAIVANSEGSLESELLHGTTHEGMFGIYQIPDDIDEARNFRFTPMREMEALGLSVDRSNYKLVHTAPLAIYDTQTNLHKVFREYNDDERPENYTGRSVSISDIIVLQWRGEVSSHYVDSVGFVELDSFLGEERKKPQALEAIPQDTYSQIGNKQDNYTGPTTAELETDVKAGKAISLTDLSKAVNAEQKNNTTRNSTPKSRPSLMERLEEGKRKAAGHGQQQPSMKKEARE